MRPNPGAIAALLLSLATAAVPQTASSGCQKDTDCKGDRICEHHECVDPPAPTPVQAMPLPPPAPPAAATTTEAQLARSRRPPREVTAQSCAPLATATVAPDARIHAGPDSTTAIVKELSKKTAACAGNEMQGFGYRLVQFTDGTTGFVKDSFVIDLQSPPPPPRPVAMPAVTMAPPPQPPPPVKKMTAAMCGSLVPAVADEGTQVRAGPDAQTKIISTLREATPVCASAQSQGFGLRRIRLPDGTVGFVNDDHLTE